MTSEITQYQSPDLKFVSTSHINYETVTPGMILEGFRSARSVNKCIENIATGFLHYHDSYNGEEEKSALQDRITEQLEELKSPLHGKSLKNYMLIMLRSDSNFIPKNKEQDLSSNKLIEQKMLPFYPNLRFLLCADLASSGGIPVVYQSFIMYLKFLGIPLGQERYHVLFQTDINSILDGGALIQNNIVHPSNNREEKRQNLYKVLTYLKTRISL